MTPQQSLTQYTELFDKNLDLFADESNRPLCCLHLAGRLALEQWFADGLPRSTSAYKETTIAALYGPDYGVSPAAVAPAVDIAKAFHCGVPNMGSLLAVVANSVYIPSESLLNNCPEGLTVTALRNLDKEAGARVAQLLTDSVARSPLAALNTMLAPDGVYIRIAAGTKIERPLQIVNIFRSDTPMLTPRIVVIDAEDGASATIILCDHSQSPDTPQLNSVTIAANIAKDANIELYTLEENASTTRRCMELFATQHESSRFTANSTYLCGGTSLNTYNIDTVGDRTATDLSGLAVVDSEQIVENNVLLHHQARHASSRQLFKNALYGTARGAFGGKIIVAEGAEHTDAAQTNRNLLGSADARMIASPQLEIYCDDVKCSHGATTGQLDERALFYMQARGIPRDEATAMLTQAFMADVVDGISCEVLRQRLHILVEKRLSGAPANCDSCQNSCINPDHHEL